jgi:hypothetical protein
MFVVAVGWWWGGNLDVRRVCDRNQTTYWNQVPLHRLAPRGCKLNSGVFPFRAALDDLYIRYLPGRHRNILPTPGPLQPA